MVPLVVLYCGLPLGSVILTLVFLFFLWERITFSFLFSFWVEDHFLVFVFVGEDHFLSSFCGRGSLSLFPFFGRFVAVDGCLVFPCVRVRGFGGLGFGVRCGLALGWVGGDVDACLLPPSAGGVRWESLK